MKQTPKRLLQELRDLDHRMTKSVYDTGRLLYAFKEQMLYKDLGYQRMAHMVDEELPYSPSTASTYCALYGHFKRLKYTEKEACLLIGDYQFRTLVDILKKEDKKLGARAIKNRFEQIIHAEQYNFIPSDENKKTIDAVLAQYGMNREGKSKRGLTDAMTSALLELAEIKKAKPAAKKKGKVLSMKAA